MNQLLATSALLALLAGIVQTLPSSSGSMDDVHSILDSADPSDDAAMNTVFTQWATHHKKSFHSDSHRSNAFKNLKENAKRVKAHRKKAKEAGASYTLSLNKYSDMNFAEFKSKYLGFKKPTRPRNRVALPTVTKRATQLASVNYTALGYVTPVKNQGDCGCCWSFSTTGMLEALYFKAKKVLNSFSEQSLVECVVGNIGCDGGDISMSLDYVAAQGGIPTESTYPYKAGTGAYGPCVTGATSYPKVSIKPAYTDLLTDTDIINALQTAPVMSGVSVNDAFMLYQSGVMNPSVMCGAPADINHAILIVGYGVDAATGKPYWLIKNSWDTDWGEQGYFRVDRTGTDACGVAEYALKVTATVA